MKQLPEGEKSFDKSIQWSSQQRFEIDEFCKVRDVLKRVLEPARHHKTEEKIQTQLKLDEELTRFRDKKNKNSKRMKNIEDFSKENAFDCKIFLSFNCTLTISILFFFSCAFKNHRLSIGRIAGS